LFVRTTIAKATDKSQGDKLLPAPRERKPRR
jgi:hypothetical protein